MSNEHISKQVVDECVNKAIYWMKEYIKEWESYSEGSMDIPAAKSEAMNIAIDLVKRHIESRLDRLTDDSNCGVWLKVLSDEPWEPGQYGRCSRCKTVNNSSCRKMPKFCPECGANMKGTDLLGNSDN